MRRSCLRLQWWFFKRYLTVAAIVFASVAGIFIVIDLSQRMEAFAGITAERGALRAVSLFASYAVMELMIEFLRFPDIVLTTAAGLAVYGIIRSSEAASVAGLGLSLKRLIAPVLISLVVLGVGVSAFNEWCSSAFTRRFETVRAVVWGKRAEERAVFTVPGRGLLCSVDRLLPDGSTEGLTVVDGAEGLKLYRASAASYGTQGDVSAGEGVREVYPEERISAEPFKAKAAPLAALRLARYGPFWVKTSDLLRLGDGEAAAGAGKVLGTFLILAGSAMLVTGFVMHTRETPRLAATITALVVIEATVRIGMEAVIMAWTPDGVAAGLCWGLFWPAALFAAGLSAFLSAPA